MWCAISSWAATIGVPTANLPLLAGPMALRGVYAVLTRLADGRELTGVANIGWRPTVGTPRPVLEVHLFDFDGDLYGQRITVVPCARLRGELTFDGLEALKRQIHRDQARARDYFRGVALADGALGSRGRHGRLGLATLSGIGAAGGDADDFRIPGGPSRRQRRRLTPRL